LDKAISIAAPAFEEALMLEKSEESEKSEFIQAKDYVDSQGYWITPGREIKRMGGEQVTIIKATGHCSDAEWTRFYSAIVACLDATKV
jgi:hypothetical protein